MQELLQSFCEVEEAYADGMFFACPALFYQLLTISTLRGGASYNVAYFLLPGKSKDVYVVALTHFKEKLDTLGLPLSLSRVRTDFELELIQAFAFVFSGTQHLGCHFHFGQAIWRKVQEIGLAKAYKDDPLVKSFLRKTISLALVPPTFVRVASMAAPEGDGSFIHRNARADPLFRGHLDPGKF